MNDTFLKSDAAVLVGFLSITIGPERLGWRQSERGPGAANPSHWEEGYTWRRSGPQPEGETPAQTHHS